MKQLLLKLRKITDELKSSIGLLLFNMVNSNIFRTSRAMCISSLKTKNKKLPKTKSTPMDIQILKRYKRNAINGDLNRSCQIIMNFDREKETIKEKYNLADFPTRFVDSVIHQFHQK